MVIHAPRMPELSTDAVRARAASLGVHLVDAEHAAHATHLCVRCVRPNKTQLLALVRAQLFVTAEFVRAVLETPSLSTAYVAPDAAQYLPPTDPRLDAEAQLPRTQLHADPRRKTLYQGAALLMLVPHAERRYLDLVDVARAAGAAVTCREVPEQRWSLAQADEALEGAWMALRASMPSVSHATPYIVCADDPWPPWAWAVQDAARKRQWPMVPGGMAGITQGVLEVKTWASLAHPASRADETYDVSSVGEASTSVGWQDITSEMSATGMELPTWPHESVPRAGEEPEHYASGDTDAPTSPRRMPAEASAGQLDGELERSALADDVPVSIQTASHGASDTAKTRDDHVRNVMKPTQTDPLGAPGARPLEPPTKNVPQVSCSDDAARQASPAEDTAQCTAEAKAPPPPESERGSTRPPTLTTMERESVATTPTPSLGSQLRRATRITANDLLPAPTPSAPALTRDSGFPASTAVHAARLPPANAPLPRRTGTKRARKSALLDELLGVAPAAPSDPEPAPSPAPAVWPVSQSLERRSVKYRRLLTDNYASQTPVTPATPPPPPSTDETNAPDVPPVTSSQAACPGPLVVRPGEDMPRPIPTPVQDDPHRKDERACLPADERAPASAAPPPPAAAPTASPWDTLTRPSYLQVQTCALMRHAPEQRRDYKKFRRASGRARERVALVLDAPRVPGSQELFLGSESDASE